MKLIQTKKAYAIIGKENKKDVIFCGKWPHERFVEMSKISKTDAIRTFPNKTMAQSYIENNYNVNKAQRNLDNEKELFEKAKKSKNENIIKSETYWVNIYEEELKFFKTLKVVEVEIKTSTTIVE